VHDTPTRSQTVVVPDVDPDAVVATAVVVPVTVVHTTHLRTPASVPQQPGSPVARTQSWAVVDVTHASV